MLAADIDGAFGILKDALAAKLRSIMRLPSTEPVDEDVPLIDQGVDSLVAVTLRTWFSKELSADVPVLRIIGGASLSELSQNVLEKLDAAALPLVSDSPAEVAEDDAQSSTSSSKTGISQDSGEGLSTPASPPGIFTPGSEGVDDSNFSQLPENSKIDAILHLSSENFSSSSDIQARKAPMSYSQLRFWAMKSFVPDQSFFTVAIGFWITDPKIDRLRHAVNCITQRHEIFRTRFCDNENGIPTQMVSSISNVNLEQVACSDRQAASEGFKNLSHHCFDPASGDTTCFILFDWGQKEKLMAIAYHHMILDGAGFDILFNELNLIHLGHSDIPPPFQYIDFSVQQRKDIEEGNMSEDIAYWRSELQTLPSPLPLLPIALSSARRDLLAYDQHEATFQLPAMLTARIKDQSRKHKANPIHFYMAALNVLLARFTETNDVCIGMADACRTDENDFKTMGLFLNLLPVRLLFSGDQTFGEMINSARTKVREAVSHNRLPFDVLLQMLNVPRSSLHSPLFQAFLDYRQGKADPRRDQGKIKPGVLNITGIETSRSRTGYDISLEVNDEPLETTVKIKLQKSSYPPEAAILLLNSYVNLLSTFSRNPALAVGGVRMFSKSELDKAVKVGQGELLHTELTSLLIGSIGSFCHETPNSQALESSGVSMSYAEMMARIGAISNTLISSQITTGEHIVIYQHPTPDWICSVLAIMSIGAVCIPVDPSWPIPRQEAVIRSADIRVILTNNETHPSDDFSVPLINISSIPASTEFRLQVSVLPRSAPAIVLYSSGTTGAPKGIILTHGGIIDRVEAMSKFQLDKPRVLQQSAITFDHALTQVFFGLRHGGCVYVVPREMRRDAKAITRLIVDKNIEYTKATPSEYHSWLWVGASTLKQATNWKVAGIGGEVISHSLLEALKMLELPQLRVFSDYGPAEATLSSYRIELDYRSQSPAVRIPLGSHLPGVSTFIVDRNRQPVPVGWPGEILIGGLGISSGYFKQPDLTAQCFVADEFSSPEHTGQGWAKLFCSGDKGRMREDGSLVFDGRISESTQIKLRGFRVDLLDIEQSILDAAEGVVTMAVITVRGELDSKFLVGHLVFVPGLSAENRNLLLRRLPYKLSVPSYMRPAMLFALEEMPMTSHGKVDRNAVAQIVLPASTAQPSLSGHMEVIWKIWCDVLPQEATSSIKPEGATDFISAGGNSILLVKLQALIHQKLQVDLPLARLLGETTLEGMANICDAAEVSSELIDWEEECRLGSDVSDALYSSSTSLNASEYTKPNGNEGIHVLVTGASGFICRRVLKQLDAMKEISRLSCVAVRRGSYDKLLSESTSKLKLYRGDLTSPLLGLSTEHFRDLSESADIIMHCGSDRSFWNPYRLLRATNVLSTKEVIRLAAPRKAPILFISSGAVDRINNIADLSQPEITGYLASKYVTEALLLDAQKLFHIPVTIIRMQDGTANEESLTESTISHSEVTDAILRMGIQMGKRFQHEELLETSMSFARVSSLAGFLCSEIQRLEVSQMEPSSDAYAQGTIRYNNYNDSISLSGQEWSTLFGSDSKEIFSEWQKLPVIPTTTWFGEAKKQGFEYLISSQTIKINDMISRR